MAKYLYVAFLFLFSMLPAFGGQENKTSYVAIALDKDSCVNHVRFAELPPVGDSMSSLISFNHQFVERFGNSCKIDGIALAGFIGEGAALKMKVALMLMKDRKSKKGIGQTLWLDSQGGLVSEAMKIGDLVSRYDMTALITLNGKCYSSCVYIYAAATNRGGMGEFGVHRPFAVEISTEKLSYDQYLSKYDETTIKIREFLSKHGVSNGFVDFMNTIPSDDIHILTYEEREYYGLGHRNIASEEFRKAKEIQVCGEGFYEKKKKWFSFLNSCRDKNPNDGIFDPNEPCWKMVQERFPKYLKESEICKSLLNE